MADISKNFEFTLDIGKTDKENRKAIPKIELYTVDIDTNSFVVSVENKGVALDLTGLVVRADVIDNQGDEISQSDARIRVEGNKIYHLINTELMNEEGTCYINYVLTNLEKGEQKVLTKFEYEVIESVYSMNESSNRNEVLLGLQQDMNTKVDETRVVEIVTEQVEGGIDLSGYSPVDHVHTNYADKDHTHNYMTYYVNPVEGTVFKDGDIICEDVEVGGII